MWNHTTRRLPKLVPPVALALLLFGSLCGAFAQGTDFIQANYTKYEHRIPMRDGVRLFTAVYVPKDHSTTYPIILYRTPYSVRPYGVDNYPERLGPAEAFAREKFIFVSQDVRGRYLSEGEFVNVRPHRPVKTGPADCDESSDTFDTIEWLLKNVPQHNGRVGMWGISYPGFYAAMGLIDSHPALKAVSPQAPIADWFIGDDFHHNGALYLAHAFDFLSSFGRPRPEPTTDAPPRFDYKTNDHYRFYLRAGTLANLGEIHLRNEIAAWRELMQHGTYDEYWKARNLPQHLKKVQPAVLTVGGWFDAEDLYGPLRVYEAIEKNNPATSNSLVMGPWSHGGWGGDGSQLGAVRFGAKTGEFYREHILLPFFLHHLKDQPDPKLPEAWVFETGRNVWRRHQAWPPREAVTRNLYLREAGKLSFDAPPSAAASSAFDEYVSDPNKPVPYIPYIAPGMTIEHMVDDQRFATARTDVLTYETDPLEADLTFAGPLIASLFVSTSGTDSDFIVKLIDVYPDNYANPTPNPKGVEMGGYQQLVRGEAFRGKFRNGFDKPEPFVPGQITKIEYTLPDIYHTFRRGHRVLVHIQSTWFPLVDRNPQTFVDIYNARREDFRAATQRVYRHAGQPSHLRVQVLDREP